MKSKMKIMMWVVVFLLLALVCIIAIEDYSTGNDNDRYDETIRHGNGIVQALEKYYKENAEYPKSLDMLIPDYLDELKSPTWGVGDWIYQISDTNRGWFSLEVRPDWSNRPPLYYDQNSGWYYDDSGADGDWVYDK